MAGKADWLAHGLAVEGDQSQAATVGRFVRGDVVICRLADRVGDLSGAIERSPYGFALVATPGGVLLGRVGASAIRADPGARAEQVMDPGPSTVRPDIPAATEAERLAERDLRTAIVTTPEGRLLGVVRREDLQQAG